MNPLKNKTKDQLMKKIEALQNRVEELEQSETLREKAEEALHHEKNKLLGIIESIEDGVYIVNQNYDIEYVNPVLEKDFGPWEGVKCYKYFHDRKKVCPWCKNKEVWAGKTVRWEWYSKKNQKTYDLIDTPIKNSDGSISKFEIFRDITERKQAEEALKESEEKYRALLTNINDLVMEIDSEGKFTYVSPQIFDMFGYTQEESIGLTAMDFVHPDDIEKCMKAMETLDEVKHIEYRSRHKDGHYIYVSTSGRYVPDGAGGFKIVSVLRDITERKKAEAALKDSEEKFKILFESAPDAYYLSNLEGTFIDGNKAAEKLFGYKKNELIGNNFLKMNILDKDEISRMVKLLVLNSRGMSTGTDEFILKRKDNRKVFTEILTHPVKIKDKNLVLGIARDITRRKKAEEEAEASGKKLRDLARHLQSVREQERTNIAREMHDELGQLTTALKMDIVRMKNQMSEEPLIKELQAMSDLTDVTIKTIKRMSSDLRPGILDDLGLLPALEWYLNEYQTRTGIQCSLDITPRNIDLDPERTTAVYRILQETFTNVARHARASRVTANLKKEKNILKLRISDNGIGITQEEISNTQSFGLIGIQERAEVFGGNVKITGKKGKGTTLVATIPLG